MPPLPGEHPRLFFRRKDIPALRAKAQTPQGREIVRRLRILLGNNGEAMPTAYQCSAAAYDEKAKRLPVGAYTLWHAAGFGMLFQITGEAKYADLGRQCVEKAFAGQRDRDDRYAWINPGGCLRAGPSLAAIAMAYDLCYDGWDEQFRRHVASAIFHYDAGWTGRDGGGHQSLELMATQPRLIPESNHWGPQVGGASVALLAIRGDDGVDSPADAARVEEYLLATERNMIVELAAGWGDHGGFAEGDGPGSIAADTGLVPAVQAWKIAGGKDFISPRTNAQWMTLKWAMLTLPKPDMHHPEANLAWRDALAAAGAVNPQNGFPCFPHRGNYGKNVFSRMGQSGSGAFAQGFAAVEEKFIPALLWTFNHCVCPVECDFDAISYPHRAALALVNWPVGIQEENPSLVLPRMVVDEKWGLFMFRNRWQDGDDIIVTALPQGHMGYHKVEGGDVIVWGLGQKTLFPARFTGKYTSYQSLPDGGVVNTADSSLGVDFSPAAGVEGLVVLAGECAKTAIPGREGAIATQVLSVGDTPLAILTIARNGSHPEAKVHANEVILGRRTIRFTGERVVFSE